MKKTALSILASAHLILGRAARRPGHRRRSPSPSRNASAWLSPKTRSTWRRRRRMDAAQSRVRQAAAQFFPSLDRLGLQNLDEKVFRPRVSLVRPGGPPAASRHRLHQRLPVLPEFHRSPLHRRPPDLRLPQARSVYWPPRNPVRQTTKRRFSTSSAALQLPPGPGSSSGSRKRP